MAKLDARMEDEEENMKYKLRAAVLKKSTNELLHHITAAVEVGFVRYLELTWEDAAKMKRKA